MQNAAFYSPHNEFLSTQVLNALELLKGNHFTNKLHLPQATRRVAWLQTREVWKREKTVITKKNLSLFPELVVCYTAVFSVVTQRCRLQSWWPWSQCTSQLLLLLSRTVVQSSSKKWQWHRRLIWSLVGSLNTPTVVIG